MKHFIVNIGCEYGSGGPDIGKMVAESLGIPFYDRDLVDQVVEKLGVDRDLVEKADSGKENVKCSFPPRELESPGIILNMSCRVLLYFRQES